MLDKAVSIGSDADLVEKLIKESTTVTEFEKTADFDVIELVHPKEGTLCIVMGVVTGRYVITKIKED